MISDDKYRELDDPAFLAERKRMREELETLTEQYQRLNEEFDRRARIKWVEGM